MIQNQLPAAPWAAGCAFWLRDEDLIDSIPVWALDKTSPDAEFHAASGPPQSEGNLPDPLIPGWDQDSGGGAEGQFGLNSQRLSCDNRDPLAG